MLESRPELGDNAGVSEHVINKTSYQKMEHSKACIFGSNLAKFPAVLIKKRSNSFFCFLKKIQGLSFFWICYSLGPCGSFPDANIPIVKLSFFRCLKSVSGFWIKLMFMEGSSIYVFFLQRWGFDAAPARFNPEKFSDPVMTNLGCTIGKYNGLVPFLENFRKFLSECFFKGFLVYSILVARSLLICCFDDLLRMWFVFLSQQANCKCCVLLVALNLQIGFGWKNETKSSWGFEFWK